MNYEEDIKIDSMALDLEWLEQPVLMLKWSRHCAEMELEHDKAKEALNVVKSELDFDIRSNPDAYGVNKVTDAAVASIMLSQERYIDANQKLMQAKFDWNVAKGAVEAFEQRKAALENMVKLYGQQYFAGPRMPVELNREWKKKQDQEKVDAMVDCSSPKKPIRRNING